MTIRLLIVCIVAGSAVAAEPYDFEAAMAEMREAEGSEYFRRKEAFLKQPGVDEFLVSLSRAGRVDTDWLAQMMYDAKFRSRLIHECEQTYREEMAAVGELGSLLHRRLPSYRELSGRLLDRAGGKSFDQLFDADGKFLLAPGEPTPPDERWTVCEPLFGSSPFGFRVEAILKRDDLPDLVKWQSARDLMEGSGGYEDGIREHLWYSKELWAKHMIVYRYLGPGNSRTGIVFLALESDEPALRVAASASLAWLRKKYPTGKWVDEGLAKWWRDRSAKERAALLRSVAKHWPEVRARLDAALEQERRAPK